MTASNQTVNVSPKLGEGVYISADVSKILDLDAYKVRRLINGFWDSYTFGDGRTKAVNFYGLIEFYVYFQCRQRGMSAQRIKKFHTQLVKDLKTPYPFAHHEIRIDFRNMWVRVYENLVKADGKLQYDFSPILSKLHRVSYGKNNMAVRFFPLKKSENIVVDPKHQFGQPIINGTNIKTKTIFNLYNAGEPEKIISNLYQLPLDKVRDAIAFHESAA